MVSWEADARCTREIRNGDADPRWWFPEKGVSQMSYKLARAVCAQCKVSEECLDAALAAEGRLPRVSRHGIWGGLTPVQRHELVKERERRSA